MAEMATIVATGYALLSAPDAMANPLALLPSIFSLVTQSWKLDTRLMAFWKRFESQSPGPIYWPQLSKGFNKSIKVEGAEGEVFPVAFQFRGFNPAYTTLKYWATCAILHSGMKFVYTLLSSFSPFLIASLPPLGDRADVSAQAKNICQCIEYLMDLGAAPVLAVFPLKVAIETLNDDKEATRELEWAKGVMERVFTSTVRILGHLPGPITEKAFVPA